MAIDNSIASLWNSFWQGPKVGGVLFGAILLVSLFAIRTFKVYRARVSNGNKFKKVSDTLDKENGEVDKKVEDGLTIGRKKPYNIRKIYRREGFSSGQNKRGI